MAPPTKPIIIDNDVISRLFISGCLHRLLAIWPRGSFYITEQVVSEAQRWPSRGNELITVLNDLNLQGTIIFTVINESSNEEISAYTELQLLKRLGRGESASIAIASHRGYDLAIDDGVAKEICKELFPSITVYGTSSLLNMAVSDGLVTRRECDSIFARIRRSNC